MPRLLQINSTANWGSTGKIAEQIGELVMSHGWDSYIAYGRYANNSQSQLIRIGSKVSQAWHLLISRLFDRHGLASKCATKRLIKKIEQIKPDIIHLHNIHGYYINYEILFNYLQSIDTPVVWTLHDCWAFTGHCAHYTDKGCYRWRELCYNCPLHKTYPCSLSDRSKLNYNLKRELFTSLGRRLHIITVSQWLKFQVKESYFAKCEIRHIYNGIDTAIFNTQSPNTVRELYGIDNKLLCLSVASTWSNTKGLDDIIRLREILPEQYAIMVVGASDQQIKELPYNIIAISRTESQIRLAELYYAANVVISTSRQETFGLTMAEAMACGTPVVAYKTTALPELITPQTGIVVDQVGDVNSMADAIIEICSRGKDFYSHICRQYAEEHFDKGRCFLQYLELYNELLKTR